MQALTHYALLGSLAAGIAGALILALVTLQHGFARRRARAEGDESSVESSAQSIRTARVADTLAVLCFAVAASLGVIGLTHQPRAAATPADGALGERMQTLEARLAGIESALRDRSATLDLKAWEERLARVESRLGAIEERATVADRRLGAAEDRVVATDKRLGVTEERASAADRRAQAAERLAQSADRLVREQRERDTLMLSPTLAPSPPPPVPTPAAVKPAPIAPAPAAPRSAPIAPDRPDASVRPEAALAASPPSPAPPPRVFVSPSPKTETPKHEAPAPPSTARLAPASRREAAPASRAPATKPSEMTLGEKLRHDWEAIKRDASHSGDDWKQAWEQLRRAFTP